MLCSKSTHCDVLEAHANDEIGRPVGAPSYRHGSWPWTLREQLSHKEPRDRTWPNFKESHKAKDSEHANVAHPRNAFLQGERK